VTPATSQALIVERHLLIGGRSYANTATGSSTGALHDHCSEMNPSYHGP
jgi:hypothetical protein